MRQERKEVTYRALPGGYCQCHPHPFTSQYNFRNRHLC